MWRLQVQILGFILIMTSVDASTCKSCYRCEINSFLISFLLLIYRHQTRIAWLSTPLKMCQPVCSRVSAATWLIMVCASCAGSLFRGHSLVSSVRLPIRYTQSALYRYWGGRLRRDGPRTQWNLSSEETQIHSSTSGWLCLSEYQFCDFLV